MAIKKLKSRLVGCEKSVITTYQERWFHFWKCLPTKRWCCHGIPSWSIVGKNIYDTFEKNTHARARKIYETLGQICRWHYLLNKSDFTTDVINILNKFHQNIKFTYDVEQNAKIFLDVLLISNGKLRTNVFSYIYIGGLLLLHGKKTNQGH